MLNLGSLFYVESSQMFKKTLKWKYDDNFEDDVFLDEMSLLLQSNMIKKAGIQKVAVIVNFVKNFGSHGEEQQIKDIGH